MQIATPGLVLREVKVGEADRILTLFTPQHGIISASAKGSLRLKSKLFSACGLFCYSEFTLFPGKTMYMVDDAQVKKVFHGLSNGVETMALAMYLAELAATLAPTGAEAAGQLRLILNSLYMLSEKRAPLRQLKAIYELRALAEAGYMPDVLCCKGCHKYDGGNFYFDIQGGYLLCAECAEKAGARPNLDPAALIALRHITLVEDKKLFAFSMAPHSLLLLGAVAEEYVQQRLDKPLRSLTFLKTVLD